MEDYISRQAKAEGTVLNHTFWALGAGLIPLPMSDIAAVTAVQLDMLKELSKVYDANFNEVEGKLWITTIAANTLTKLGSGLLGLIPIFGLFGKRLSMGVFSGAATYALGETFIKHLEEGGTFTDFDVTLYRELLEKQFKRGKEIVENIKEDFEQGRIKDLDILRRRGVLNDEEFEEMVKAS